VFMPNHLRMALIVALASIGVLASIPKLTAAAQEPIPYETAASHEIKPQRFTFPLKGVTEGMHQLQLTLTVSRTGTVTDAKPDGGDTQDLQFWPQIKNQVLEWKFTPFDVNGKPANVQVEEFVNLVPPERFPTRHITPPTQRPDSRISITLERTGCFGSCPAYTVTLSTTDGIVFNGAAFVSAKGKHTDKIDANVVRTLAKKFIDADFYSMDSKYQASVTDNPGYYLSISIDGHEKKIEDYVGSWVGMPEIITELENDVDTMARTQRWIRDGAEGAK
jgi:hypothetical protein